MRLFDSHRFRRKYFRMMAWIVPVSLLCPAWFFLWPMFMGSTFALGAVELITCMFTAAMLTFCIVKPRLQLSEKQVRLFQKGHQAKYPGECIGCGYNVSHTQGPICPECGDPLPEVRTPVPQASGISTLPAGKRGVNWRRFTVSVSSGSVFSALMIFGFLPQIDLALTTRFSALVLPEHLLAVEIAILWVVSFVPGVAIGVRSYWRRSMIGKGECRCRLCGLLLRGLVKPICPGCGEAI